MKWTYTSLAIAVVPLLICLIIAICWHLDHSRLERELADFEHKAEMQELRQDEAELTLFRELEPGHSFDDFPGILLLADEIIGEEHRYFDLSCEYIAKYATNAPNNFHDCDIVVFNVSPVAVPFHGGSYWIVTRDKMVVTTFVAETTIGG